MSAQPDHHRYVRQVVLPSGRTIEVVYFEDPQPAAARSIRPARRERGDLHLCGECSSELVYPIEWEEADATQWEVSLRCPNCEWTGTGVYDQSVVERFDSELDRGTEALVRDLQSLARANMEEDVERFITALNEGHLLPSDF
ncbi:MAG TPA: hypothetical protein VGN69_10670 [Solirubrobacteraceae bacterium]|jgi:hypothetical protein|nr:hypothetical protein [Solirubrobacteraceae bacterium]